MPIEEGMRKLSPKSGLMVVFGLLLLAAGCNTVPKPSAEAGPTGHLVIVNLSDCEWQISISPMAGGETHTLHLAVRALQAIDLSPGDYVIEQTALVVDAGPDSARRFKTRIDVGQTYRWRLATLLSALREDPAAP